MELPFEPSANTPISVRWGTLVARSIKALWERRDPTPAFLGGPNALSKAMCFVPINVLVAEREDPAVPTGPLVLKTRVLYVHGTGDLVDFTPITEGVEQTVLENVAYNPETRTFSQRKRIVKVAAAAETYEDSTVFEASVCPEGAP